MSKNVLITGGAGFIGSHLTTHLLAEGGWDITVVDDLTREHIVPFAQQGIDNWMNVVTACKPCNHRKSSRTPEQARMPLLYAPYVPSLWEDFILRNRRILADQMEFLMMHLPLSSRLHP